MQDKVTPSDIVWKVALFDQLTSIELYEILKLRSEVFVVEQNCPCLDPDGDDLKALHLWAELDNRIVAYCRIFAAGIKYEEASIGRVLTALNYRQLSLGKNLMNLAIQIIQKRYATSKVRISAQDYLLKFYTEFGFEDTGKKYLEDDIPHTEMVRKSSDIESQSSKVGEL